MLNRIAAMTAMVESARSVPMSSNCMINRAELLSALEELRNELPGQLQQAQQILDQREQVILSAHGDAQRILVQAQTEKQNMVSNTEITLAAEQQAAGIVDAATAETQRLRDEVESYVDTSLANFEQLLQRTLETVKRGRNRMSAVVGLDPAFEPGPDEKPLPF